MSFMASLYQYAKSHSLDRDAYFKEIEIEWLLCVKKDLSVHLERLNGPRKGRGFPYHMPIMLKRSSGIKSNFPSDNPMYVLGMDLEDEKERRDPDWHEKCHAAYIERIETAAAECGDEDLRLVAKALRKHANTFGELPGADQVDKMDWVCPATLKGDSWVPVSEQPRVRQWWIEKYPVLQDMVAGIGKCMVTGEEGPLARIHPLVTGVDGGKGTGATLITFNAPSGTSFGQSQGMNAPIGVEVAILCAQAYSQIMSRQSGKRRSLEIEHGLHMGFIPKKEEEEKAADFIMSLLDPVEDDYYTPDDKSFSVRDRKVWKSHRTLFNATGTGILPPSPDTPVDILVTRHRESSGRIEVLRFDQESYGEIHSNLKAYFNHLEIYDPWAGEVRSDFPLRNVWPVERKKGVPPVARGLLDALKSDMTDEESGARPEAAAGMFLAAIEGRPIPPDLLGLSVAAAARAARKGTGIPTAVAALLKIQVNRNISRPESHLLKRWNELDPKWKGVNAMLDPESRLPSYVLGRFLAAAERIQEIALPNVTAGVVKRLYDGMSKSPAAITPAIIKDMNHHIHKIARAKPGLAGWCRKISAQILALLPAQKDKAFPRTFDLQDQSMFGLGYYHQRSDFFRKKADVDPEGEPTGPVTSPA